MGKAESTYLYSRIIFQLEVLITLIDPSDIETINNLKAELEEYKAKKDELEKQKALH